MKPKRMMSMQAMRALAAWTVVIGHMTGGTVEICPNISFFMVLTHITATFYQAGVDMFFVISGAIMFIITNYSYKSGAIESVVDFIIRRIVRIYPLYWITFAFSAWAFGPFPSFGLSNTLYSLILVHPSAMHPVAWTLIFEIRFYAIVAIVLLLFRDNILSGFTIACALWAGAVFFGSLGVIPTSLMNWSIMPEFIIGVFVGALIFYEIYIAPVAMIIIGVTWIVCTALFIPLNPVTHVIDARVAGYGVSAAFILYGVLSLEGKNILKVPSFLVKAGDSSYSVYLWHLGIVKLLITAFDGYGAVGAAAYMFSSIVIIAIVGHLSYRLFERPLMDLVHRHGLFAGPSNTSKNLLKSPPL